MTPNLIATDLDQVSKDHKVCGDLWHEFLRVPALSAGLYVIPVEGEDPQQPHNEDEVYLILTGKAQFTANGLTQRVSQGSILYVARTVPHTFHDIEEELRVLVFFAPAHT